MASSPGPARWRGGKPAVPGHPSQLVATSEPLLNGGGDAWQAAAAGASNGGQPFAPPANGSSWGAAGSGTSVPGTIEHAADQQWSVAGDGAGGQPYFAPLQRRSAGATSVDGELQPLLYGEGGSLGHPGQQYSEAQYVPASLGGQAVHRQLGAALAAQAHGDAAAQYSSGDEEKGSARLAAVRRPATPMTPGTLRRNSRLAMLSMLLLVFQGTALSIMLRYSRARAGTPYLASVSGEGSSCGAAVDGATPWVCGRLARVRASWPLALAPRCSMRCHSWLFRSRLPQLTLHPSALLLPAMQ